MSVDASQLLFIRTNIANYLSLRYLWWTFRDLNLEPTGYDPAFQDYGVH